MDVEITTEDADAVSAAEIAEALTAAEYYVRSVKVLNRANIVCDEWTEEA